MGFWSQQELGGSERLWLCNYRPPEVNYSYLCLVPPIWTTQAARPLSSLCFSPSLLNPWSGPNHPTLEQISLQLFNSLLALEEFSPSRLWSISSISNFLFSSSSPFFLYFFLTFFSSPLPSFCTQPALRTALKRQFPEIFPPWEKKEKKKEKVPLSMEVGGFNTPVGGCFMTWAQFLTWNISPCVWHHDEMRTWKMIF